MGQGASVRANTKLNRKIGDAELAAIGKAFVVWSPTELRKLLGVFREITGGAVVCNKRKFLQSFTGLYGFSTGVQERCFDLFDANKDGSVDFEEFVRGLTICQRGRPEERIRFLFEMYSADKASLKFDDVIHILWDAAGQGAQQGHTAELRALRSKSNGQLACPIKYLTDDADAQQRIMTTYRTKAQLLFDSHALCGHDFGAGPASDSDSDDDGIDDGEDDNNGSFTESKTEDGEAKRAESRDTVHVPPLRLNSVHDATTRDRTTRGDMVASYVEFSAWCMSGILQYQDVLKRLNPIPTVQEEGSVILSILQAACTDHLVEGTVWCAVSMRWWQRWMDYCCRGDDVMRALTGNSVLGLSHSALSPFRAAPTVAALSTPIVGTRAPGHRRISERASVLGHFSSVLPEVGRAIYEGGAFTGAEAVAGSGKRASRVAHNAFDRRGTLSSAAPHRSGSPSSPVIAEGNPTTPTRRSVLVPADASSPPVITNTPQINGLSTPTRSLASLGRTVSFGEMNGRPGPIDNSDLQGSHPDLIRLDAVEHEDFVLIPDAAWTQLMAWYGGGPTFPRFVVDLSACSEVPGGDATKHMEVDVWPIPLSVMYSFPDKASSGSRLKVTSAKSKPELTEPVLHIRVSAQKPWVELFASLVELKHAVDSKAAVCSDAWPAATPLSQQIISTIRSMNMEDYRLHVQSVMGDEVLHYRTDTRDPLDTVENSFLVGGELIVLEKRALSANTSWKDGSKKSPRVSNASLVSKASALKNEEVMNDGWTLASIKGPQLWTEVEVGDYIDADVATGGGPSLWKAAVVLEVASLSRYHVSVLEGSSLSNTSCWVTDSTIAPFRTRSGGSSRHHQRKTTVHYALDSALLQAASRKLSSLPLPALTTSAKSLSIGNDLGAIPAALIEGVQVSSDVAQRRRTYKADVTFRRQSMVIAATMVRGSCGLKNLGNTCFMASVLQCLNSASTMTEYFLSGDFEGDVNESNPLGLGGRLAEEYGKLLKDIWSSRDAVINPLRFKVALSKFAPQFSGHNQHDGQELLAFLLDGLHEDLNRVSKKPYVEALDCAGMVDEIAAKEAWRRHLLRDQSVIVDLFQGQLKSTLTCLNRKCGNKSVTFEPFMSLSLPVPADAFVTVSVTVIPRISVREVCDGSSTSQDVMEPRVLRLRVPRKSRLTELLNAAAQESGIQMESFIISDVYKNKIYKTISDTKRLSSIRDSDTIVLHETDPESPVLIEVLQAFAKPRGSDAASSKSRTACGLPFILSCTLTTTNQQVHEAIGLQLSHWTDALKALDKPFSPVSGQRTVASLAPHLAGHTTTEASTEYYRIVVVNSKAGGCGLCRRGGQCEGCELPLNDQKIELIENTAICVEWKTEAWSRLRNRVLTPPPFIDEDGLIGETPVKLAQLLDEYVKEEVLTGEELWYCPKCDARQSASKKLSLWAAPHYLVIHLKRFSYTHSSKEKIHRPVEFPVKGLDLSAWTMSPNPPCCDQLGSALLLAANKGQHLDENPRAKDNDDVHMLESKESDVATIQECDEDDSDTNPTFAPSSTSTDHSCEPSLNKSSVSSCSMTSLEKPQLLYDLFAVSSHMGTMGGGHYTSTAQSSVDGNWYLYDDDIVKPYNPQAMSASDAYVLFYRRRV